MNNIIEYHKQIEVYKNQMLEIYKNIIVAYEDSRVLYENIIKEYDNNVVGSTAQVVPVSKVKAENKAWVNTEWQLHMYVDGEDLGIICDSASYGLGDTWSIDLTQLKLTEGREMYLKACVIAGSDSTSKSTAILKYDSKSSDTAYFQLTGTAFNTTLNYKGVV